jgi:hypothetical protein
LPPDIGGQSFVRVEERGKVLAGLHGADKEDVIPGEAITVAHTPGLGGPSLEIGIRNTVVNDLDPARIQSEQSDGIVAGGLGNGNEAVGSFPDAFGQKLITGNISGGVELGRQPSGSVVESSGERRPTRGVEEFGSVEDIGTEAHPIEEMIVPQIQKMPQSEAVQRSKGATDRSLMIQRAGNVQEREYPKVKTRFGASTLEMHEPMVEVILNTGAPE